MTQRIIAFFVFVNAALPLGMMLLFHAHRRRAIRRERNAYYTYVLRCLKLYGR